MNSKPEDSVISMDRVDILMTSMEEFACSGNLLDADEVPRVQSEYSETSYSRVQ